MSIRGFIKAFIWGKPGQGRSRHSGDDLAEEIRDAIGPVGGGGEGGGRMSGGGVYRHLENRER